MQTTLVTGSTGLLGNNIVRLLTGRGVRIKALARLSERAAKQGRVKRRAHLVAGRRMTADDLFGSLAALRALAAGCEPDAGVTGKPVPLSRASVKLPEQQAGRSHHDHAKSDRELGCTSWPAAETLADTAAWYQANGDPPACPVAPGRDAGRRRHGVVCPADRHRDLAAGYPHAPQH